MTVLQQLQAAATALQSIVTSAAAAQTAIAAFLAYLNSVV
jgi:hypothetical protein